MRDKLLAFLPLLYPNNQVDAWANQLNRPGKFINPVQNNDFASCDINDIIGLNEYSIPSQYSDQWNKLRPFNCKDEVKINNKQVRKECELKCIRRWRAVHHMNFGDNTKKIVWGRFKCYETYVFPWTNGNKKGYLGKRYFWMYEPTTYEHDVDMSWKDSNTGKAINTWSDDNGFGWPLFSHCEPKFTECYEGIQIWARKLNWIENHSNMKYGYIELPKQQIKQSFEDKFDHGWPWLLGSTDPGDIGWTIVMYFKNPLTHGNIFSSNMENFSITPSGKIVSFTCRPDNLRLIFLEPSTYKGNKFYRLFLTFLAEEGQVLPDIELDKVYLYEGMFMNVDCLEVPEISPDFAMKTENGNWVHATNYTYYGIESAFDRDLVNESMMRPLGLQSSVVESCPTDVVTATEEPTTTTTPEETTSTTTSTTTTSTTTSTTTEEPKVCVCSNGVAEIDGDCPEDGATWCSSCNSGFTLNTLNEHIQPCEMNMCYCVNGETAYGEGCPAHDQHYCISCIGGYYLNATDNTCDFIPTTLTTELTSTETTSTPIATLDTTTEGTTTTAEPLPNICLCYFGTPVAEENCTVHGNNQCQSCESGYHLDSNTQTCNENVCNCENGTGSTKQDCPNHNDDKCDSCAAGFYLDENNQECLENVCSCANGNSTIGTSCASNGDESCSSCDSGYYLPENSFVCQQNQCTCPNGVGNQGIPCPTNNDVSCSSCNFGYFLDDSNQNTCQLNSCQCPNGLAAQGTSCPTNDEFYCLACDITHYLDNNDNSCNLKVCDCENGTAQTGINCPILGENKCASCDSGYHLAEENGTNSCMENVCDCENGLPVNNGTDCTSHGENLCASDSCFAGFHYEFDSGTCETNQCYCTYGTAAIGAACENDSSETCSSCNNNEHLYLDPATKICTPNCDNLNAGIGYHFDIDSETCQPNTCTCNNGRAPNLDSYIKLYGPHDVNFAGVFGGYSFFQFEALPEYELTFKMQLELESHDGDVTTEPYRQIFQLGSADSNPTEQRLPAAWLAEQSFDDSYFSMMYNGTEVSDKLWTDYPAGGYSNSIKIKVFYQDEINRSNPIMEIYKEGEVTPRKQLDMSNAMLGDYERILAPLYFGLHPASSLNSAESYAAPATVFDFRYTPLQPYCPAHNSEHCSACLRGYQLNQNTHLCEPRTCSCSNGTPAGQEIEEVYYEGPASRLYQISSPDSIDVVQNLTLFPEFELIFTVQINDFGTINNQRILIQMFDESVPNEGQHYRYPMVRLAKGSNANIEVLFNEARDSSIDATGYRFQKGPRNTEMAIDSSLDVGLDDMQPHEIRIRSFYQLLNFHEYNSEVIIHVDNNEVYKSKTNTHIHRQLVENTGVMRILGNTGDGGDFGATISNVYYRNDRNFHYCKEEGQERCQSCDPGYQLVQSLGYQCMPVEAPSVNFGGGIDLNPYIDDGWFHHDSPNNRQTTNKPPVLFKWFNGNFYGGKRTWNDARTFCRQFAKPAGATDNIVPQLAAAIDWSENDYLIQLRESFGKIDYSWLGGKQIASSNEWHWLEGEDGDMTAQCFNNCGDPNNDTGFTWWDTSKPDFTPASNGRLVMNTNSRWDDAADTEEYDWWCQVRLERL